MQSLSFQIRVGGLAAALFLVACGSGAGPEKIAQRFVQHYYIETDLQKAAEDCDGLALEKVQRSQSLVAGQTIDRSTRHPEIFYNLIEGRSEPEEANYLFRVTIRPPDFQEMVRKTSVKLRKRTGGWKVTQFSDES